MSTLLIDRLISATTIFTQATEPPSPSLSWGIVLFFPILGLLVTLSPARRTTEIKRSKDE